MGRSREQFRTPAATEPEQEAREAGLRYVAPGGADGIWRRKRGAGFSYVRGGRTIRDPETLRRIGALVIPPAWTDVWICPQPNGHLQALGRDARLRKQYRYHTRWRAQRDQTKFGRMIAFGKILPRLRTRVAADVAGPGLSRTKVIATVVRLLETTLKNRHVAVAGGEVRFHFRGKSGKTHQITIHDPRIARIVKRCRDIPGYELFQFIDDEGQWQTIDSADVNEYIQTIAGDGFTAKDFRTWAGTVLMAEALILGPAVKSQAQANRHIVGAIKQVAERLGNTAAVCRKSYIHPAIIDAFREGELTNGRKEPSMRKAARRARNGLPAHEAAVLTLLERRLAGDRRGDRLQHLLRRSLKRG